MFWRRGIELIVGLFIIFGVIAFIVLAFKVSGLTTLRSENAYRITADFNNIGDLKVRAPVTIAGVTVGRVTSIKLDPATFQAVVTMEINNKDRVPVDSTANIFTAGLIGMNYISVTPGFEDVYLKEGGKIEKTNQALILQNLIGKLLFNLKKK